MANPRWKPLHVPASFNATARRHQKLLAKGNWFKKRKSPEDDEDQPEQSSSPAKRKCLSNSRYEDNILSGGSRLDTTLTVPVYERDGNMITNLDKTYQKDNNAPVQSNNGGHPDGEKRTLSQTGALMAKLQFQFHPKIVLKPTAWRSNGKVKSMALRLSTMITMCLEMMQP